MQPNMIVVYQWWLPCVVFVRTIRENTRLAFILGRGHWRRYWTVRYYFHSSTLPLQSERALLRLTHSRVDTVCNGSGDTFLYFRIRGSRVNFKGGKIVLIKIVIGWSLFDLKINLRNPVSLFWLKCCLLVLTGNMLRLRPWMRTPSDDYI